MICVSLGRANANELLAEHRRLLAAGVPLVEWRLDYLAPPFDLAVMLAQRPGPVIVTVRRAEDGGQWRGTNEDHDRLIREAIAAGVEYVDLEEDTAARIPRTDSVTKRIVSLHDFHATPENLETIHARLAGLGADVVKLATVAQSTHDNFRMLRLIQAAKLPTVGMCMGELGLPTRLLAGRCGAPWIYAATDNSEALAPGQISFRTMLDLYRYPQITAATEVYGVIGDPIGHSLSPAVHNTAFAKLGLDKVYIPFRVPPIDLPSFLNDAQRFGIRGLSVTIPHKEGVLAKLTDADESVRAIGAANTLLFDAGKVHGTNTDLPAVVECLALGLGQSEGKADFRGKTALVLGAGGAAKAVVYALADHGAEVAITSRTQHRAEELAATGRGRTVPWDSRHDEAFDILVNCTPLGMFPNVNDTPYDAHALRKGMMVFDTVYNPEQTRLVREARQAGATVVTGVEMFVRQAAIQFKLFTGHEAPCI